MKNRIHSWAATAAVIMALLFVASCATTTGGEKKLSEDEIRSLLAGKTIHQHSPNRMKTLKLKKNGRLIITDYQGKKYKRKWFMQGDAWCIKNLNKKKSCYFVYELGKGKYDIRRIRDYTSIGVITISE